MALRKVEQYIQRLNNKLIVDYTKTDKSKNKTKNENKSINSDNVSMESSESNNDTIKFNIGDEEVSVYGFSKEIIEQYNKTKDKEDSYSFLRFYINELKENNNLICDKKQGNKEDNEDKDNKENKKNKKDKLYIDEFSRQVLKDYLSSICFGKNEDLFANLNEIATKNYESGHTFGKILICEDENSKKIHKVMELEKPIEFSETKLVRKLVEMSSDNLYLISNGEKIFGMGYVKEACLGDNDFIIMINFEGKNKYKLTRIYYEKIVEKSNADEIAYKRKEEYLVSIINEKPEIKERNISEIDLEQSLKKLYENKEIAKNKVEKLKNIVLQATKQKKGTMIVISDKVEEEMKILSGYGMKIKPKELDRNYFGNITGIDGAVLLDLDGRCHGVGVILDGAAKEGGGFADRGARYNSAIKYYDKLNDRNEKVVIVVISEDGMIDIIPDKESIEKQINEWKSKLYKEMENKKWDSALEIADKIINENNTEFGIVARRGYIKFMLERYIYAIEDYNKAIELDKNYVQAYYGRGIVYRIQEEYEKAIEDYNKAIELDENYVQAYYGRGIVYRIQEEYEKAIEDYNKVIELDKNRLNAYYGRGIIYRIQGEYEKALEDYNKVIELDENDVDAYYGRGIIYRIQGEYKKALKDYNKVIELDKNYVDAYYGRGIVYRIQEEYEKAIEDYNKVIELDKNYVDAYYGRGIVYRIQEEYEKAIEDYNKAIELDENYVDAYYGRGIVYRIQEEYEKAIEDYNKAIELDENYVDAYYGRGIVYGIQEEYEKAIEDYNKAIELDENYVQAYYGRGIVYRIQGEYEKALKDYNKVIELDENDVDAYNGRGNVYYLQGEDEKAIEDYNTAIELDENYKLAYKNRANLHKKMGNDELAEADMKKYEELKNKEQYE
ncbi:tetratricopeptide repeat protein [Peptostreptococcaceae bacterium AGR-M142]